MDFTKLTDVQYQTLKKRYLEAVNDKKDTFTIWEQTMLVGYAKYLLQAIESHRKDNGLTIIREEYKQKHSCADGIEYDWIAKKQKPVSCPRCKARLDI